MRYYYGQGLIDATLTNRYHRIEERGFMFNRLPNDIVIAEAKGHRAGRRTAKHMPAEFANLFWALHEDWVSVAVKAPRITCSTVRRMAAGGRLAA